MRCEVDWAVLLLIPSVLRYHGDIPLPVLYISGSPSVSRL